jgi:hypothetical protein
MHKSLDCHVALHHMSLIRWAPDDACPNQQGKGSQTMSATGFEDFQKVGKESVDAALQSVDAVSKGFQAIASETADYSRQSFQAGSAALEQLLGATTLDKAVEIQSAYLRSAYQDYVGQVTKVGEIVADIAKSAYKPYEGTVARFGK